MYTRLRAFDHNNTTPNKLRSITQWHADPRSSRSAGDKYGPSFKDANVGDPDTDPFTTGTALPNRPHRPNANRCRKRRRQP